eukprot:Pgem_evm1s19100
MYTRVIILIIAYLTRLFQKYGVQCFSLHSYIRGGVIRNFLERASLLTTSDFSSCILGHVVIWILFCEFLLLPYPLSLAIVVIQSLHYYFAMLMGVTRFYTFTTYNFTNKLPVSDTEIESEARSRLLFIGFPHLHYFPSRTRSIPLPFESKSRAILLNFSSNQNKKV